MQNSALPALRPRPAPRSPRGPKPCDEAQEAARRSLGPERLLPGEDPSRRRQTPPLAGPRSTESWWIPRRSWPTGWMLGSKRSAEMPAWSSKQWTWCSNAAFCFGHRTSGRAWWAANHGSRPRWRTWRSNGARMLRREQASKPHLSSIGSSHAHAVLAEAACRSCQSRLHSVRGVCRLCRCADIEPDDRHVGGWHGAASAADHVLDLVTGHLNDLCGEISASGEPRGSRATPSDAWTPAVRAELRRIRQRGDLLGCPRWGHGRRPQHVLPYNACSADLARFAEASSFSNGPTT
jgi:hypothetical protein